MRCSCMSNPNRRAAAARFRDEDDPACFAIEPIYYGNLSAVGDFKREQTGAVRSKACAARPVSSGCTSSNGGFSTTM